ncbi:MAG: fused FliR family export protein/FlhB family type III secretion system protein [Bacillota bacterium]|nr:fused FliR family export protein/FlhB family type III secretion system protein [Bacillota bacterium]
MINTVYFLAILMIFLRMLTFCAAVPIFFPKGTPNVMKIFIAAILAIAIAPAVSTGTLTSVNNNIQLLFVAVNEIITGLVLGYITNFCFDVIRLAGQMMDIQMGLSMISMFDPNSNSNSTLIDRLLYWVSFIVFLLVDGHHVLITSLIQSFTNVGLGKSILSIGSLSIIMNTVINYFAIGLKIAIPIVLIILITDITLGLISRTVPQLNVMIFGLPIKILVGLTIFSLALPGIIKEMIVVFQSIPHIFNSMYKAVPIILIFASEEKTEDATPRKKRDAKQKGQVAKSKEVPLALTLLVITLVLAVLGSYVGSSLKNTIIYFLSNNFSELTYESVQGVAVSTLLRIAAVFLPVVVPIMVFGVLGNYIQTGFIFSSEPLKPKLSKLNPLSGFKRIFSVRSVVELIKQLALVSIVGYVGYSFVKSNYLDMLNMSNLSINEIPGAFGSLVVSIFTKITLILMAIALIDYIYQRYMYNKDLRMTKQEIKEEFKQDEGDPQIKSKIKQKQRESASRRMMASVPDATVVITNPTHIAVALQYEGENMGAPKVVAKGTDYIALKIKEIARDSSVPIIENKPLARLIYSEIELDQEIPVDMYQAVAEILAVVFKMKKKK